MEKPKKTQRNSASKAREKVIKKLERTKLLLLSGTTPQVLMILVIATVSVYIGWYVDSSTPFAGRGMADQSLYEALRQRVINLEAPGEGQLHYTLGYPLLSAIATVVWFLNPFMTLSFLLFVGALLFFFFGAKKILGSYWALLFIGSLLLWDGVTRSFSFFSELFMLPWSNQTIAFAFAFYFWLFTTRLSKPPSWRIVTLTSLISGITFFAREEAILFCLPATVVYLLLTKAGWKKIAVSIAIIGACFMPQVVIKQAVLGSPLATGRVSKSETLSYGDIRSRYLQPNLFLRNTKQTILNSGDVGGRKALLQASPWLWLGLVGVAIMLFSSRYDMGLKLVTLLSALGVVFYLSGNNMSAVKLQFHCLRYIAPFIPILHFGAVVTLREFSRLAERKLQSEKVS